MEQSPVKKRSKSDRVSHLETVPTDLIRSVMDYLDVYSLSAFCLTQKLYTAFCKQYQTERVNNMATMILDRKVTLLYTALLEIVFGYFSVTFYRKDDFSLRIETSYTRKNVREIAVTKIKTNGRTFKPVYDTIEYLESQNPREILFTKDDRYKEVIDDLHDIAISELPFSIVVEYDKKDLKLNPKDYRYSIQDLKYKMSKESKLLNQEFKPTKEPKIPDYIKRTGTGEYYLEIADGHHMLQGHRLREFKDVTKARVVFGSIPQDIV